MAKRKKRTSGAACSDRQHESVRSLRLRPPPAEPRPTPLGRNPHRFAPRAGRSCGDRRAARCRGGARLSMESAVGAERAFGGRADSGQVSSRRIRSDAARAPRVIRRSPRPGAAPTTISRCSPPTTRRSSAISATRNSKYAGTTSTFFRRDGKFYVNTDGPDGTLLDFEISYTFGISPLQQYLIELPGGRLQALGIAWDSRPKAKGASAGFISIPIKS